MTAAERDVPLATKLDLQQGQAVTLSGTVLHAKRLKGMTEIEVLHAPVGPDGRPTGDRRLSQGRFLVRQTTFLDPAILAPRPMITVRGMVEGEIIRPLEPGADDYTYPLIAVQELNIWPVELLQPWYGSSSPPAAAVGPAATMGELGLRMVRSVLMGFVRALVSPRSDDGWSSSSSSSGSSAPAARPSPPPERIPRQFQKGR
jgi:starvation-inducible outer membrane lipoprotein